MRKVKLKKLRVVGLVPGAILLCSALIVSGAVVMYGQYAQSLQCLAHLIYVEARGMDEQAQYDVAHSVMNRVAANRSYFGGNTVCGVVYYSQNGVRQYSGVSRDFTMPKDLKTWHESMTVARNVLTKKVAAQGAMKDALYYLNPKHSSARNVAWFRSELREVGWSGDHLFFTDK